MRSHALFPFFAGLLAIAAAGCDSGDVQEIPPSTFPAEDAFARRITGRVLRGTEPVSGALVQVDPAPGFGSDARLDPHPAARAATTDAEGRYRVQSAPFRYDLYSRNDGVAAVIRDLRSRGFDLQLGDDLPVRGYQARIVAATDRPPAAGNALAFFVSGAEARGIVAAPATADGTMTVIFRHFETTIKLHVVEYVASVGLAGAVAQGSIDVRVREGATASPIVPMLPAAETAQVIFDASPPSGYALSPVEVLLDFGLRTSTRLIARATAGVPVRLPLLPARYSARVRATGFGASSDSGQTVFDPRIGRTALVLPAPLSAEAPIDDTLAPPTGQVTLGVGGLLSARMTGGVVEHVLEPVEANRPVIRIATASRTTTLPDVTRLGFAPATGSYLWSIEHLPLPSSTDKLSGEDARAFTPSSRSVSRLVVLR